MLATFKPLSFHELQALRDDLAAAIQDETGKVDSLTFSRVFFFSKTLREAGTAHDQQCAEHELALHAEMHHGKMTAQPTPASPWRCLLVLTSSLKTLASIDVESAARSHVLHERLGPRWNCTKNLAGRSCGINLTTSTNVSPGDRPTRRVAPRCAAVGLPWLIRRSPL